MAAPAIDDPATRTALADYARRSLRATLVGFAAVVGATVVVDIANGEPKGIANAVALLGLGGGVVPLCGGLIGLERCARARRLLKRRPWETRLAHYRIAPIGANGQPALVVDGGSAQPEGVFALPTTVWRYRRLRTGTDGSLLFAAGGRRWALVAPPDRSIVIFVKKPLIPWWRNVLRRIALKT